MPPILPESTDSANSFEDLSGISSLTSSNPYDALILASKNEPAQIQARYDTHRLTRNEQQRAKLLDPAFCGLILDPILQKLEDPTLEPGYTDPRHCLVFWARPPGEVRALVASIQQKLRVLAPNLWLMPSDNLHMTALEITHSLTKEEIQVLQDTVRPKMAEITDYTFTHRARLIKPMLSYDSAAIALSFLPAAGEGLQEGRTLADDQFTYHNLRRDLYDLCQSTGVTVASRYTVPSAHLTIGRFVTQKDFQKVDGDGIARTDAAKLRAWVEAIESINSWLKERYWPGDASVIKAGGEWSVGKEKGLDHRKGTLWYGGGETVRLGKGF